MNSEAAEAHYVALLESVDDRERSGVLSIGSGRLAGLVRENEVLQVSVDAARVPDVD